jgi:predicted dehydrogenase
MSRPERERVAMVGCGSVAEQCHLPALLPRVGRDGIWLVDPAAERRAALARRFGRDRQTAATPGELEGAVGTAIVAVPNDLHARIAAELLEAGVHVLCEKPLATSVAEAEGLLARRPAGVVLAVAQVRRFLPSVSRVHELLRSGELGAPVGFQVEEGSAAGWSSASAYWLDRRRAGGGVLVDIGSHVLDLVRFWLGELEVERYADDAHGGVEANCRVELRAGSVPGTVELSRTHALPGTIRIECERGTIEAPTGHSGEIRLAPSAGEPRSIPAEPASTRLDGGYAFAFAAQLDDFLRAVADGGAPEVSGEDALPVLAAIERCYAVRDPLPEPWVLETLP